MTVETAPAEVEATGTAERRFSQSMVVSGTRCLLTYLVFPYLLPVLGLADTVGPTLGVVIGVVAIVFNGLSIRRFWRANHRLKWPVSMVNAAVIVLLGYLMAGDLTELAG
ncbi:hypothetical protein [Candidatus Poriferisocius sp.]|uniref:hypothetical protein n=1 Tax=Candidatus Poriferisocius sp. TaxID=3101276 RepID=UPI003B025352